MTVWDVEDPVGNVVQELGIALLKMHQGRVQLESCMVGIMVGVADDVEAGLGGHPDQASAMMVSEPSSIVIVLLFLDAGSHENNVAICGVGDVQKLGACGGGKVDLVKFHR